MISYKKLYLGIIIPALIICITACAVVQPLSGGNKDVTSPTLHYSLPGINAVNVSEQKFAFVFSEEIALSNFYKNININPYYPSKNIKTFIRGKKLTLTFLEPLNSNTTYNIDFGKSVVDVTEKNPALNLNYTFSTGAEIDTLIYEGILLDNLTHKPSANTLVTLREKGNISADTTLPSYTTLTNTTGNFSFHGLVNKEFTVQAYTDLNNNKMFDKTTEQLAILDHSIFTSEENNDTLYLFKPRISQTKMKAPTFGESYMDVSFTSGIKELISTSEKSYHVLNDNKTIRFYAPDNKTELSVVALDSFNLKIDTTITYTYRPETITEKLIDITGFIDREKPSIQQNYSINTLYSVSKIDTSKIKQVVNGDTINIAKANTKTLLNQPENKLTFITDNTLDTIMILLDTNAISFKTGHASLPHSINYIPKDESKFGSLSGDITTVESNYVFYIKNTQKKIIYKVTNADTFNLPLVEPGNYTIEVLIDKNNNDTYDTGSLTQLPEPYYIHPKVINVKPNWEVGNIHISF